MTVKVKVKREKCPQCGKFKCVHTRLGRMFSALNAIEREEYRALVVAALKEVKR